MEHNYFDTLITVSEDCKVTEAKVPQPRGDKPTVAMLQYDMLIQSFEHTQEHVLFEVWLARQEDIDGESLADDERQALFDQFFAKGQPCFRASPLTKTHGWGVVFDTDGKAALVPMESPEYAEYVADKSLTKLAAMRSKRVAK